MRKIIVLTALIATIVTAPVSFACDTKEDPKPKTMCAMLEEMLATMKSMESKLDASAEEIASLKAKVESLQKEVDELKATLGSFSGEKIDEETSSDIQSEKFWFGKDTKIVLIGSANIKMNTGEEFFANEIYQVSSDICDHLVKNQDVNVIGEGSRVKVMFTGKVNNSGSNILGYKVGSHAVIDIRKAKNLYALNLVIFSEAP